MSEYIFEIQEVMRVSIVICLNSTITIFAFKEKKSANRRRYKCRH